MATQHALPNCLEQNNARKGFSECAKDFQKKYTGIIPNIDKKNIQQVFFEVASKEYKNNLVNNLLNATKLATLPATGSDLKRSANACKMKAIFDFDDCHNRYIITDFKCNAKHALTRHAVETKIAIANCFYSQSARVCEITQTT
jgi:hypothetical protein